MRPRRRIRLRRSDDHGPGVRVAVFTARTDLEGTPHWALLQAVPGVRQVLLCCQAPKSGARAAARSLRRNLKKHGPIYLVYRPLAALKDILGRPEPELPIHRTGARVTVERITVADLHSEEALDAVRRWKPDLGLSIGAPILRRELFSIPSLGTVNVHAGKVPDYRGAPPGFWELYSGAEEVGATLHWITEELDAGDVVAEATAPIYPDDTLRTVQDRAEELAARVMARGLSALANGTASSKSQEGEGRTFRSPTLVTRFRLWLRMALRRLLAWLTSPKKVAKVAAFSLLVYGVRPIRDAVRTIRGTHPVRVFTFHRVTTLLRDGMTVSPRRFRDQIRFVRSSHRVLSVESALEELRTNAPRRRPIAVLSFDDGYRSVLERAFPLMEEVGLPGTCFLSTSLVGTHRRFAHDEDSPVRDFLGVMDWEEIELLRAAGWSVGGHTRNHARVSELEGDELEDEICGCFQDLVHRLGEPPETFAYPFGLPADVSPEAADMVARAGFSAAFMDYGGDASGDLDWFRLPRKEIGGDHATLAWKAGIHGFSLRRRPHVHGPRGASA